MSSCDAPDTHPLVLIGIEICQEHLKYMMIHINEASPFMQIGVSRGHHLNASVDVALLSLYSVNSVWEEGVIGCIDHKKKHILTIKTPPHTTQIVDNAVQKRAQIWAGLNNSEKLSTKSKTASNSNYLQWLQWLLIMHHCISKLNGTCPKQAINKDGNSTPACF